MSLQSIQERRINLLDNVRGGRSYEKDEEDFGAIAYYW
jgi:hypothetical protein